MNKILDFAPDLILAPVTANQDWIYRFTAMSAKDLREAIARAPTKGRFTLQINMGPKLKWVRIFNNDTVPKPYELDSNFISKTLSERLWKRVAGIEKLRIAKLKEADPRNNVLRVKHWDNSSDK